jgi:hypothetical protein
MTKVETLQRLFVALATTWAVQSCGGSEAAKPLVVPQLSAQDAILQVSSRYDNTSESSRLLSPPSSIAIKKERYRQSVSLSRDKASERVEILSRFEYRDGSHVECEAALTRPLQASYRFIGGEPAVKLIAAATPLVPRCTGAMPEEFVRSAAASVMELVLRDESLVVVAPATDRRRFLPADDTQGLAP